MLTTALICKITFNYGYCTSMAKGTTVHKGHNKISLEYLTAVELRKADKFFINH